MKWHKTHGIPDDLFIRSDVPMTKEEIRSVVLSKLRLDDVSIVIDIGAGTGSVSVECGLIARSGRVYCVERNETAQELIRKNAELFELENITVLGGEAPEVLEGIKEFDRVFVGGSGGRLYDLLRWIDERLRPGGRVVVDAITMETLAAARHFFAEGRYDIDIVQIAVTRCQDSSGVGMLKPLTPVFIITAERRLHER